MIGSSSQVEIPTPETGMTFRWTSWPIRETGRRAWGLPVAILLLAALAGWISDSWIWALSTAVLMGISVWRYFVPVRFEIQPRGLVWSFWGTGRRLSWLAVRRYELDDRNALLLTTSNPAPLDYLRAARIPLTQHREQIVSLLAHYLGPPSSGNSDEPESY
jgi:hypothetical protein